MLPPFLLTDPELPGEADAASPLPNPAAAIFERALKACPLDAPRKHAVAEMRAGVAPGAVMEALARILGGQVAQLAMAMRDPEQIAYGLCQIIVENARSGVSVALQAIDAAAAEEKARDAIDEAEAKRQRKAALRRGLAS